MKKIIFLFVIIIILCQSHSQAQRYRRYDAGVGLRLGDPLGFTYKNYMPGAKAVEVNLGSSFGYANYYSSIFNDVSRYDDFVYISHSVNYSFALQGRLLFHNLFPEDIEGLEWYYGFGAQAIFTGVDYQYRRNTGEIRRDNYTDLAIGPDGILGIEYNIPEVPLSAFLDVNLFMELVNNPFRFRFMGGLGVRYNFNFQ